MRGKRYTDESKIEAIDQATERGHSVAEVSVAGEMLSAASP